jgi:general stress protein 26
MKETDDRIQSIQTLSEMLEEMSVAMLTTVLPDGALRSRPMVRSAAATFDGSLWFFTPLDTAKVADVAANPNVNAAFSEPIQRRYVSLSGRASIVKDRKKIEELWDPTHGEWIPQGRENPDLVLLKLDVEEAEYWDAPSSAMHRLGGLVKRVFIGEQQAAGEHGKVDWKE